MKKTILLLVVISLIVTIVSVFSLVGCKTEEKAVVEEEAAVEAADDYDPKDHPIAYCMFLKNHPSVQIMIAGFLTGAKELGYDPILLVTDDADLPKMYGVLEAGMVQHKIAGLVQHIIDDSTAQYVNKYADMGIPVVTAHHAFIDKDQIELYSGLSGWAASDEVAYGAAAAMAIGEQVGGKGTVAVTEGSFNTLEDSAANSFTKTMNENFPDIKVLPPEEEGFDIPTAIQKTTAIMQANPDIVGAFSTTGEGPSTWAGAQSNTGKKIVVIAMDYNRVNLDLVANGECYAVVAQPLFHEFAKSAELLDTILRGGTIEYDNLIDAPLVTADNVGEYYDLLDKVDEAMKDVE